MTRDKTEALGYPDDLPAAARQYWPDVSRWPTPSDVRYFRRSTRRNPEARLAVLNGLRSWSQIDLASVWSWTGIFITVVIAGIGGTIVAEAPWVQVVIGAGLLTVAYVFLVKLASLSSTADQRRRRAHIWLRALE